MSLDETIYTCIGYVNDDGGDYDWSAIGLYRRVADGALFYTDECGCSCYGPGDDLTEAELTPLDTAEYLAACHRINPNTGHEQGIELLQGTFPIQAFIP